MPTFTIITVCLNIVSTIRRTCESIVNQTFQDFQWIVVDGASTDGTLDILKEYSSRINIFISESDKGIYNAMNKGIRLATGEYIIFMNGGDEFYNIGVLREVKDKQPIADVIYGRTFMVDKNYIKEPEKVVNKNTFYKHNIVHQSAFIKTALQKKYIFDETLKICSDYDFFVKILFKDATFEYHDIIISKFYSGGFSEINHQLALNEESIIRQRYYNFISKIKYDPVWNQKFKHYFMIITHPRYIAGWIKNKIIDFISIKKEQKII